MRAAGGVVLRRPGDGGDGGDGASRSGVEVMLVHRPKYNDWSLPKGKLAPGEDDETAALREVEEETGLRCVLGPELAGQSYVDGRGRPKVVRFWAMEPVDGSFVPGDEVDEARWYALGDADRILSYDRDRAVLSSAGLPSLRH